MREWQPRLWDDLDLGALAPRFSHTGFVAALKEVLQRGTTMGETSTGIPTAEEERLIFARMGGARRLRTVIGACLDESGSMGGKDIEGADKREAAIRTFNDYLAEQQTVTADDGFMAVVKFNTSARVVQQTAPIQHIRPLTEQTYFPNGGTALFDAIAHVVAEMEKTPADRYVVVILTDGEENSSRETTIEQVRELIATKEATQTWTFTYLSADIDAFTHAQSLGIAVGNTMSYTPTAGGTYHAGAAMGASMRSVRESSHTYTSSFYQPLETISPPVTTVTNTPPARDDVTSEDDQS